MLTRSASKKKAGTPGTSITKIEDTRSPYDNNVKEYKVNIPSCTILHDNKNIRSPSIQLSFNVVPQRTDGENSSNSIVFNFGEIVFNVSSVNSNSDNESTPRKSTKSKYSPTSPKKYKKKKLKRNESDEEYKDRSYNKFSPVLTSSVRRRSKSRKRIREIQDEDNCSENDIDEREDSLCKGITEQNDTCDDETEAETFKTETNHSTFIYQGVKVNGCFSPEHFKKKPVVEIVPLSDEEIRTLRGTTCPTSGTVEDLAEDQPPSSDSAEEQKKMVRRKKLLELLKRIDLSISKQLAKERETTNTLEPTSIEDDQLPTDNCRKKEININRYNMIVGHFRQEFGGSCEERQDFDEEESQLLKKYIADQDSILTEIFDGKGVKDCLTLPPGEDIPTVDGIITRLSSPEVNHSTEVVGTEKDFEPTTNDGGSAASEKSGDEGRDLFEEEVSANEEDAIASKKSDDDSGMFVERDVPCNEEGTAVTEKSGSESGYLFEEEASANEEETIVREKCGYENDSIETEVPALEAPQEEKTGDRSEDKTDSDETWRLEMNSDAGEGSDEWGGGLSSTSEEPVGRTRKRPSARTKKNMNTSLGNMRDNVLFKWRNPRKGTLNDTVMGIGAITQGQTSQADLLSIQLRCIQKEIAGRITEIESKKSKSSGKSEVKTKTSEDDASDFSSVRRTRRSMRLQEETESKGTPKTRNTPKKQSQDYSLDHDVTTTPKSTRRKSLREEEAGEMERKRRRFENVLAKGKLINKSSQSENETSENTESEGSSSVRSRSRKRVKEDEAGRNDSVEKELSLTPYTPRKRSPRKTSQMETVEEKDGEDEGMEVVSSPKGKKKSPQKEKEEEIKESEFDEKSMEYVSSPLKKKKEAAERLRAAEERLERSPIKERETAVTSSPSPKKSKSPGTPSRTAEEVHVSMEKKARDAEIPVLSTPKKRTPRKSDVEPQISVEESLTTEVITSPKHNEKKSPEKQRVQEEMEVADIIEEASSRDEEEEETEDMQELEEECPVVEPSPKRKSPKKKRNFEEEMGRETEDSDTRVVESPKRKQHTEERVSDNIETSPINHKKRKASEQDDEEDETMEEMESQPTETDDIALTRPKKSKSKKKDKKRKIQDEDMDVSIPELGSDFLASIPSQKTTVTVSDDPDRKREEKRKERKKKKKLMKSFIEEDGYIPLEVGGPTKFAVVGLDKFKSSTRHPAFDLKRDLLYGSRVKRVPYSQVLAYNMKVESRKFRF